MSSILPLPPSILALLITFLVIKFCWHHLQSWSRGHLQFKTNVIFQIIRWINSIVTLFTCCFCIIILVCICFNILVLVCVITPVCKGASQSWGFIVHNNQLPAWKCGLSNIYFVHQCTPANSHQCTVRHWKWDNYRSCLQCPPVSIHFPGVHL